MKLLYKKIWAGIPTVSLYIRIMDVSAASLNQDQGEGCSSRYNSRAVIRRIIRLIVARQLLLERAALRPHQRQRPHLNKEEYLITQEQTRLIEDILYSRSSSLEEYGDLNTLQDRVLVTGRALHRTIQRHSSWALVRGTYRKSKFFDRARIYLWFLYTPQVNLEKTLVLLDANQYRYVLFEKIELSSKNKKAHEKQLLLKSRTYRISRWCQSIFSVLVQLKETTRV